jgi:hypothetical protein
MRRGPVCSYRPRLAKWITVVSFITNLSDTAAFIFVNISCGLLSKLDFGIGLCGAVLRMHI